MLSVSELQEYIAYLAKHPSELQWAGVPFGSTPLSPQGGTSTLPQEGNFRPGEMIALHIHPTNEGPPLPPSGRPGLHKHEFIEIPSLWSGHCRMEVEGNAFPMGVGDFLILDTNSAHRPMVDGDTLLINLAIRPAFFNETFFRQFDKDDALAGFFASSIYSQKAAKRHLLFQTNNDPRIRQLFTMILQEYFSNEVCSKHIVENLVMVLFSTMVRLQRQRLADVTAAEQISDTLVSDILAYMNQNLQSISRDMLADHFGYSYNYIATVLQAATGMTFSKLKNTLRIQYAELLLRTTDRPIAAVAHDSGFSNVTSFYELFKRSYGVTPQDYRNNIKKA